MLVIRCLGKTHGGPVDPVKPEAKPGSLQNREPIQVADNRFEYRALIYRAMSIPDKVGHKWWYLVFKPFEDSYSEYKDWFETKKFPEWCRDKLKAANEALIWTVEKDATRHHVNMMIQTDRDLSDYHDHYWTGYCKLYCQPCYDRDDCIFYIFKEALTRPFIQYIDYYISTSTQLGGVKPNIGNSIIQATINRVRKALFNL